MPGKEASGAPRFSYGWRREAIGPDGRRRASQLTIIYLHAFSKRKERKIFPLPSEGKDVSIIPDTKFCIESIF